MHSFDSTAPYLVRIHIGSVTWLLILAGNLIILRQSHSIGIKCPTYTPTRSSNSISTFGHLWHNRTSTYTHTHTHPFSLSRGKFKRLAEIGESQNTLPQIATFLTPAVDLLTSLISLYMYSQLRNWWLTKTKWMVVTWRCVALSLM